MGGKREKEEEEDEKEKEEGEWEKIAQLRIGCMKQIQEVKSGRQRLISWVRSQQSQSSNARPTKAGLQPKF